MSIELKNDYLPGKRVRRLTRTRRLTKSFVIGVFLVTAKLCFASAQKANNETISQNTVESSVLSYLNSDSSSRIFISALKQSKHWDRISIQSELTLFIPTDSALQQEGSAFLLEIVLVKPENSQRLDDLIANHIISSEFNLHHDTLKSFDIKTDNKSCFAIEPIGEAIKVGPEAFVTKIIKATNGHIMFLDRMLWAPYSNISNCN